MTTKRTGIFREDVRRLGRIGHQPPPNHLVDCLKNACPFFIGSVLGVGLVATWWGGVAEQ